MARILLVHSNFPGQFGFLARALTERGHACAAIASHTGRAIGGIPLARWSLARGTTPGIFPPAVRAEADLLRGGAAARAAIGLRERGFVPDLVVAHPGWGETLHLREVFPGAKQILYGEFFYRSRGGDVGFDPEFPPPDLDEAARVRAKNATGLLAFADANRIVSPTAFQAGTFPPILRPLLRVIHEGVDTDAIAPAARGGGAPVLADGTRLGTDGPVVTFANRRFEPMRGFHTFMRALPRLQAAVPEARIVLVGADEAGGYGLPAGDGTTWKARLLGELDGRLDLARIHFTGPLPHADLHAVLRIGAAHAYLTYPFALSWSLIEAMSLGCLVVGSRTAPVAEVIVDGENGHLVDMFDPAGLADRLISACRDPAGSAPLRAAARRTAVSRFDRRTVCLPAWLNLIDEVLAA